MKEIVGQEVLLSDVMQMKEDFPLFLILAGSKGSGKKIVADWISKQLGTTAIITGITVSDIRSMRENAHKLTDCITYIIPDADTMSAEAKGALLKITEEPPKKARFIMTLQNVNSMPDTIISRAVILYMNPYSADDLAYYAVNKYAEISTEEAKRIKSICDTPGEVDLLMLNQSIYDYAETVVDNIAEVSTANALKIGDKLLLKKDDVDKYDLALFWKIFIKICLDNAKETNIDSMMYYADGAHITNKYLSNLFIKGANKQMLFTNWILSMRKEWA